MPRSICQPLIPAGEFLLYGYADTLGERCAGPTASLRRVAQVSLLRPGVLQEGLGLIPGQRMGAASSPTA
jgi:hypothetical protein